MYQISSATVSFRINELEKNTLNEVLTELQEEMQTGFGNAKEFVFALITKRKQLENELQTAVDKLANLPEIPENNVNDTNTSRFQVDFTENNEVLELMGRFIENESLPVETDLETIVSKSLTKSLTPVQPETITVEKEVVKEIHLAPNDNQLLLELKPKQKQIIETICQRRNERGFDNELHSPEKMAELLIFNKATLFNWGGEFPTGLNLEDFKK